MRVTGSLILVWLALLSVYSFIGCRSFAVPTTTTSLGSSHCGYPSGFPSLLSLRELHRRSLFSFGTPFGTTLRSSTATVRSGDVTLASACVDVDSDSDTGIGGANFDDNTDNALALYIHIPYCRQRCRYCDFAIVPIGDHKTENGGTGDSLELGAVGESSERGESTHEGRREQGFRKMNDRYIDAVVAELKQIAAQNTNKEKKIRKVPLRSIYFGGGTPSLAPIESIEKILKHAIYNADAPFRLLQQPQSSHEDTDKVTNTNDLMVKTEITMEMDPGTFDREYLSSLRDLGINRVSLGVQSFDDDLLRAMGRTHRRADVLQAVRDIAFVFGGNEHENNRWENVNYSIDLISGCPGLTPAKWVETLQEATVGVKTRKSTSTNTPVDSAIPTMKEKQSYLLSSLPPPKHISVYDLQIEEGTVFGKWAAKAKEDAAAKRKEGKPSNTTYHDGEDEDPARDFTVALPLGGSSETSGLLTQSSNPKQKQNQQQQRLLHLPSEDECAFMYKYAAGYLRAKKYEHYEVSSYAAFNEPVSAKRKKVDDGNCIKEHTSPTSKRSVHNQIYWEYDGQWYAVGLGATSFVDKELVARPRGMHDYIEWVHEENAPSSSTTKQEDGEEEEEGTCEDLLSDLLLKRLRTIDGLDLNWLETNYGSDIVKEVLRGAQLGLDLELAEHTDDNFLQLADPHGIFAELGYT